MDGLTGLTAPKEIVDALSKYVPLLASAVGAPGGGFILSLLGNLFGVAVGNNQGILDKINSTPDVAIKLKEIENQNRQALLQIVAQNYQTEVTDRTNARLREMTLKDWVPTILAIGFLINYAVMQFYCVTHSTAANDIISARFQDVLIMIISYYFGSSHKTANAQS